MRASTMRYSSFRHRRLLVTVLAAIGGVVAGGAASGCGDTPFMLPSPEPPPGADREIWNQAFRILREAAAGHPPYGRDVADDALGTLGIFRDRKTLFAIAGSKDLFRAAGALRELVNLEPERLDLDVALRAALDPDPEVRAQAPGVLGAVAGLGPRRAKDPRIVETLRALAADPETAVRRAAFAAARPLANPREPPPAWLVAGLHDPEGIVRAAAASSLGWVVRDPPRADVVPDGVVAEYLALLDDAHEGTRATVMRMLARTPAGRTRLEPFLTVRDVHTRLRAAALLAAIAHTGTPARMALETLLHDSDAEIRRATVAAVHGAADSYEPPAQDEVAATLLPLLADARISTRVATARVLLTWNLGDYREVSLMALRPIAEGNDNDALASAGALAVMDDPRGDAALIRLLATAPLATTRGIAANYLVRITGDHVLPALARALGDSDPSVRVEAAGALLRSLKRR